MKIILYPTLVATDELQLHDLNIADKAVEVQQKANPPIQLDIIGEASPKNGIVNGHAIISLS